MVQANIILVLHRLNDEFFIICFRVIEGLVRFNSWRFESSGSHPFSDKAFGALVLLKFWDYINVEKLLFP